MIETPLYNLLNRRPEKGSLAQQIIFTFLLLSNEQAYTDPKWLLSFIRKAL